MAIARLQEDLLQHFREEKRTIGAQIGEMEPLSISLRKPAAARLAGKGLILFCELLCWTLLLTAIAACIFLRRIYPFHLLFEPGVIKSVGRYNSDALQWAAYALIAGLGALCALLARCLARVRKKNDILHFAGARLKNLVGQHLQRKAAIDTLEQRHFGELPHEISPDVIVAPNPAYDVNEGVVRRDS